MQTVVWRARMPPPEDGQTLTTDYPAARRPPVAPGAARAPSRNAGGSPALAFPPAIGSPALAFPPAIGAPMLAPARPPAEAAGVLRAPSSGLPKAQKRIRGTLYSAGAPRRAMSSAARSKCPLRGAAARGGRGTHCSLRNPRNLPQMRHPQPMDISAARG